MNHFLERAKQLEAQMQEDRHYLHKHAEAGEHQSAHTSWSSLKKRQVIHSAQSILLIRDT